MSRRRKHRIKLRSLYVWHRYVGLAAALFVLVLATTGLALNHSQALHLDQRPVRPHWLLQWYGLERPLHWRAFRLATGHYLASARGVLYLDARPLEGDPDGPVIGAVAGDDFIAVASASSVRLYGPDGEFLDQLDDSAGTPGGIRRIGIDAAHRILLDSTHGRWRSNPDLTGWEPAPGSDAVRWSRRVALPDPLRQDLTSGHGHDVLTLEQVLLDLHSGHIFGRYGPWAMDGAALLLLFLALTGGWIWLKRRR